MIKEGNGQNSNLNRDENLIVLDQVLVATDHYEY